eukprot:GCRY01001584.1.p1 GENE.GCRY01001584.1~~GCRY01001584.1.p1  ORF type:complete len:456 (+),score=78.42 GCRY01001584.1:208-1575(+)
MLSVENLTTVLNLLSQNHKPLKHCAQTLFSIFAENDLLDVALALTNLLDLPSCLSIPQRICAYFLLFEIGNYSLSKNNDVQQCVENNPFVTTLILRLEELSSYDAKKKMLVSHSLEGNVLWCLLFERETDKLLLYELTLDQIQMRESTTSYYLQPSTDLQRNKELTGVSRIIPLESSVQSQCDLPSFSDICGVLPQLDGHLFSPALHRPPPVLFPLVELPCPFIGVSQDNSLLLSIPSAHTPPHPPYGVASLCLPRDKQQAGSSQHAELLDKPTEALLQRVVCSSFSLAKQEEIVKNLGPSSPLIEEFFTPDLFSRLIERNPQIALHLFDSSTSPHFFEKALSVLAHQEISLQTVEIVTGLSAQLTEEFLGFYIDKCLTTCRDLTDLSKQTRMVRLVCAFLRRLAANPFNSFSHEKASPQSLIPATLIPQIQAFCLEFSKYKEATSLYRSLKTML